MTLIQRIGKGETIRISIKNVQKKWKEEKWKETQTCILDIPQVSAATGSVAFVNVLGAF